MKTFKVETIVVGFLESNCYLLINSNSHETIIIDPGAEAPVIKEHVQKHGAVPIAIINTHGHLDHIGANDELRKMFKIPLYAHREESAFYSDPVLNGSVFLGSEQTVEMPDHFIEKDGEVQIGPFSLGFIHTPGHTPGGMCVEARKLLFTGDTLFRGTVGRWDLPGGNEADLMKSMKMFSSLPRTLTVYPGHGSHTTLETEFLNNPFLKNNE